MTNDERLIETSKKKNPDLLFFPFSTPRISKSFCEGIVVNLQLCNLKLKKKKRIINEKLDGGKIRICVYNVVSPLSHRIVFFEVKRKVLYTVSKNIITEHKTFCRKGVISSCIIIRFFEHP